MEGRLRKVLRKVGAARTRELEQAGITRTQIVRLVSAGQLQRIGRGLYAPADYQGTEHSALVAVAKRAPNIVFCLLTALRFHEITTQSPFEVWIAIANKDHPPRLDYPPLRTVRFSEASLRYGVEVRKVEGVALRITGPAKTVADCFKFRNKVGLDVALDALREVLRERKATADELWRCAKVNRVANVMRPYLEATA
ncbi:MAG: type IV toxin-antitoxin system AbiEi family antitoxin domain-containing protein [Nitrospira sp.]|nr:type IV toxin-antitoxin system AbiEi family antitoxin domain-containing protein [Nitrospira sp.]